MLTDRDLEESAIHLNLPLVGIFARDKVPTKRKPGAYLVNLDDSSGNGTHWVAFKDTPRGITYFDSFGFPPPLSVMRYAGHNTIEYNAAQLQNVNSGVCGSFCLAFLYHKGTLRSFIHLFSKDVQDNRRILQAYLHNL